MTESLLLYCRPGLENDAAAEIMARTSEWGFAGYVKAVPQQGWLQFFCAGEETIRDVLARLRFEDLIFARQWVHVLAHLAELPVTDRVSPIEKVYGNRRLADIWVEYADTNDGKELSKLARGLEGHLQRRLIKTSRITPEMRGHVLMVSGTEAFVGISPVENSARWPLGYPRLRFPKAAPSRSTLKLEEAWHVLLGEDTERWPRLNQHAVDLGAAPGGWTWQLINRGVKVTAVDNGPMDARVMEEGRVTHLREDAFAYKPAVAVDWMVCDVVEKPAKVAQLAERWIVRGWCKQAIFNLKLPMKKRFQEVEGILGRMHETFEKAGIQYQLRAHQLYHDREEITVWIGRISG